VSFLEAADPIASEEYGPTIEECWTPPPGWTPPPASGPRPGEGPVRIDGKFLGVGSQRLVVRGVTYGTFAPGPGGQPFPSPERVTLDFETMNAHGINAVRLYTPPPRWLLDVAAAAGLWVMVGLPWEQHVAFLEGRRRSASILAQVRAGVAACAGHPAILCYAVGNEIPAAIIRWHGRRRVERFLAGLCETARDEGEGALVTYVNFPSTEYLSLPAADILAFNVYLEDVARLEAYVARLQNLSGDRPLLLGELGLDSVRAGLETQASGLAEQVRTAFAAGCAGAFVFAWTDEWHRGGEDVLDWDFGLTGRDRTAKPALEAVARVYCSDGPPSRTDVPLVSVVVCTRNGAATLRECIVGVLSLDYPRFEVIVVDDGSTDESAEIARSLGARVISTLGAGLGAARNTGIEAARGEIVAYIDDDAWPDRDWLRFIAAAFNTTDHVAVGGPNLPPPDATGVAACVANAPGGPVHVLASDTEAEHLPGCNMAFRRDALIAVGGFDSQFQVAGDDVDICWRLSRQGMTLGFHPAAVVWHRRRATVRRFWHQQRGYGRAEALLERKWPERYNTSGHARWGGRLYGRGTGWLARRTHVYQGTWGAAAFQREIDAPAGRMRELATTPEWYLVLVALALLAAFGAFWSPLLAALPVLALAFATTAAGAVRGARAATFGPALPGGIRRLALRGLTLALHLLQPAARLAGRTGHGLVPWRRPCGWGFSLPAPRRKVLWAQRWLSPEERLRRIDRVLRAGSGRVRIGGPYDHWDLHVWGGALGAARLRTALEEHGRGRQVLRYRIWPVVPRELPAIVALLLASGASAVWQLAFFVGVALFAVGVLLVTAAIAECGIATAGLLSAIEATACTSEPRMGRE
jgi:glycosyltransferase involved in cell wall biosynthesis